MTASKIPCTLESRGGVLWDVISIVPPKRMVFPFNGVRATRPSTKIDGRVSCSALFSTVTEYPRPGIKGRDNPIDFANDPLQDPAASTT